MKRTDIINLLIKKNNYKSYLEIGVYKGKNFEGVTCEKKIGVDPDVKSKATIHKTSDDFFSDNKDKFDIIFIDGLHHAEQVKKDILNSLKRLNKGGVILCHDMNPTSEAMQTVPRIQTEWTGDCWKAFVKLRQRKDLSMYVIDTDYGVGIIRRGKQEYLNVYNADVTYKEFAANKKEWLNLKSVEEFLKEENL